MKRPGKPTLQIGKEAAPNLPAVATEAKEEIIEGYLREWERAGVSPKGPQCSPQIFSQLEHRCSTWTAKDCQFFPRWCGVRFRAWCHWQVPSYLWGQTQGLRPRARGWRNLQEMVVTRPQKEGLFPLVACTREKAKILVTGKQGTKIVPLLPSPRTNTNTEKESTQMHTLSPKPGHIASKWITRPI